MYGLDIMLMSVTISSVLVLSLALSSGSSVFECSAPRSPDNGLSFIFQDGGMVRFRCHPGFELIGQAEAHCTNNEWDNSVPICKSTNEEDDSLASKDRQVEKLNQTDSPRTFFTWSEESALYGVGPRRLPLINGLFKTTVSSRSPSDRVLTIGGRGNPTQLWTKTAKTGLGSSKTTTGDQLLKQELGIAEIRHRQKQEILKSRPDVEPSKNKELSWRQKQIGQARQSPTVLYGGSRAASAYRGDKKLTLSESTPVTLSPRSSYPAPPPALSKMIVSPTPSLRLNDPDMLELRRKQIEQTLKTKMESNRPAIGRHNSEKAGLVEEARRRQYEFAQSLRNNRIPTRHSDNVVSSSRQTIGNSNLFSVEKAGPVDATVRQYSSPGGLLYTLTTTTPSPSGQDSSSSSTEPSAVLTPPAPGPLLARKPQISFLHLPTFVSSSSEKAGQTNEALYQQYLQAEHLRHILEYETAAQNNPGHHRQSPAYDPNTLIVLEELYRTQRLSQEDLELLRRLSPDLQANYIYEVLATRGKQNRESYLANDFLRRYYEYEYGRRAAETFPSHSTRTSRTGGQVTIIQSQPSAPNGTRGGMEDWLNFDLSCHKHQNGQRLFIRAPKVKNAYVHRYERKRNPMPPNNAFQTAEYRCRRGYRLLNPSASTLYCRKMEWVGTLPRCLAGSIY